MRVPKDDVEIRMEIPGAVIRQRMDFGDVRGFDKIIMFSPQREHSLVIDHMIEKVNG